MVAHAPHDGLVVVVKEDCATCRMVAPVLRRVGGTVITQDNPSFPFAEAFHDVDLGFSWRHDIETVPTLIRYADGAEAERTVGWARDEWRRISGVADLGDDLPPSRPGCGSLSVDPDRIDALRALHDGQRLRSRRIELAEHDDEFEMLFDRGFTDGLPVVPPTEARVLRMLDGTTRNPGDVVAVVAPDLVEVTVEKVAVNAVMAGCLPEYLPWVLTAVEAVCNDTFNIHGVLATTMPVGPVIVCSGPGAAAIGINAGGNALGQGARANLTIGRAVQLVVRNVGGGRPGEVDRATHGNPGKVGLCFAELEGTALGTIAADRGIADGTNALTVFAGEGPRCVVDQQSRTPESLASTMAVCLLANHHPKLVLGFDSVLVIGPEHARVFLEAGWDRQRVRDEIMSRLERPGSELVRGAGGIAEGVPEWLHDATLAKFKPDGLLLAHAGGGAGLFSAIIAGWANGEIGSTPVTLEVHR
jgi:hypothetical protein